MESQTQNLSSQTSSGSRSLSEFVCSLCGDSFKRLEHLSRHKLSHTEERPYSCPTCNKSFTRKDTLSRHIPIHSSNTGGRPDKRSSVSRVSRACCRCARSRLRCGGEAPCGRCTMKNAQCTYLGRSRRRIAVAPQLISSISSGTRLGNITQNNVERQTQEQQEEPQPQQRQQHPHQMQLQSPLANVDEPNGRLLADYEALNTLSSVAMDLTTPIPDDESGNISSSITQQDSMGPPHDAFSSTTSITHHAQQPLANGHNDMASRRTARDVDLTPPGQTQSIASFSTRGRQQSTATFTDSGVVTNGDTSTSAALSLGSPGTKRLNLQIG